MGRSAGLERVRRKEEQRGETCKVEERGGMEDLACVKKEKTEKNRVIWMEEEPKETG